MEVREGQCGSIKLGSAIEWSTRSNKKVEVPIHLEGPGETSSSDSYAVLERSRQIFFSGKGEIMGMTGTQCWGI